MSKCFWEFLSQPKITDFTKIEDYLKPKADIKKLIRRTVHRVTGQVLATVEPERYYMRFYHPGVDEQGQPLEDKSVEQELREAVEQELAKRFNAQVSRITADVYDTDIAKHFKKLYGTIGSFEVEIASIADIEEPVTYKGDFQIEGVEANSWYTFQARQPEISEIRESIQRRLNAVLSNLTKESLQNQGRKKLEDSINQLAIDCVIRQFGLEIRITNLYSPRTQKQKSLAEEKLKQFQANQKSRKIQRDMQLEMALETKDFKLKELKELRQERLDNIVDSDEEELEELDEKIKALESEALTSSLEDDAENILKPHKSRKALSLDQLVESVKLEGGKDNPLLNSASDTDISETEGDDIE